MEILSTVASGIAVVSLSIQLIDCIRKIQGFFRSFREISQECSRLVNLLDFLESFLNIIHNLMRKQGSLQSQDFPEPLTLVFQCKVRCEKTLQPLVNVIEEMEASNLHKGHTAVKFKNIKFVLKSGKISEVEKIIRHEMEHLNMVVNMNTSAILIHVLPHIRQSQQKLQLDFSRQGGSSFWETQSPQAINMASKMNMSIKTKTHDSPKQGLESTLAKLCGIRYRSIRKSHYSITLCRTKHGDLSEKQQLFSEEQETSVLCTLLGYGFTWTRQKPFSIICASIQVYPVISEFPAEIRHAFKCGSVKSIQEMISRGTLHPQLRDEFEYTILHLAASLNRADICELLLYHGVKPKPSRWGITPASQLLWLSQLGAEFIDTYRCLLSHGDLPAAKTPKLIFESTCLRLRLGRWEGLVLLWQWCADHLLDDDLTTYRLNLLEKAWRDVRDHMHGFNMSPETRLPELAMDDLFREEIESGRCGLLAIIFRNNSISRQDSYLLGSYFTQWLASTRVDIHRTLTNETERLQHDTYWTHMGKQISINHTSHLGWILGWEYILDRTAPAHLLVNEFVELVIEHDEEDWFYDPLERWEDWWDVPPERRFIQQKRFDRRTRRQEHKDGARRKELKRQQSRMRLAKTW